jgi:putative transposase
MLFASLVRWIAAEQHDVIEYLRTENRVLKAQVRGRRVCLSDAERRRLAILGARLGRPIMTQVATLVTADTILRWHPDLSARKGTYSKRRPGRPRVDAEIRGLVARMAMENPTWGYTRIQGALKNLGHRVTRSTVANTLKEQGIPPSGQRPMSWRTFLRAHRGAILGWNFFTAAGWTLHRWLTYYAVCTIERSRRVRVMASTPYPHEPMEA